MPIVDRIERRRAPTRAAQTTTLPDEPRNRLGAMITRVSIVDARGARFAGRHDSTTPPDCASAQLLSRASPRGRHERPDGLVVDSARGRIRWW